MKKIKRKIKRDRKDNIKRQSKRDRAFAFC